MANSTSFKKGVESWNKGVKGYGKWSKWNPSGEKNPFYGKKHSEETRAKMRKAKLGKVGELTNNWRGGTTKQRTLAMSRDDYKQWRKAVFERDNYTCQSCNIKGGDLEADHIKAWCSFPDLRYEISNGQTLCKDCHRKTSTYGIGAIYGNKV